MTISAKILEGALLPLPFSFLIMKDICIITKCYLRFLCYSHEVEKTERRKVLQGKKVKRKRPHVTRNCVLHKVV